MDAYIIYVCVNHQKRKKKELNRTAVKKSRKKIMILFLDLLRQYHDATSNGFTRDKYGSELEEP